MMKMQVDFIIIPLAPKHIIIIPVECWPKNAVNIIKLVPTKIFSLKVNCLNACYCCKPYSAS